MVALEPISKGKVKRACHGLGIAMKATTEFSATIRGGDIPEGTPFYYGVYYGVYYGYYGLLRTFITDITELFCLKGLRKIELYCGFWGRNDPS